MSRLRRTRAWVAAHRRWILDAAERILWTLLEVVLGFVTVDRVNAWTALHLGQAAVPFVAAALAAVKASVARHIGNPETAAIGEGV
jgi:hypothetical protein